MEIIERHLIFSIKRFSRYVCGVEYVALLELTGRNNQYEDVRLKLGINKR